jgi:hypothetical protein
MKNDISKQLVEETLGVTGEPDLSNIVAGIRPLAVPIAPQAVEDEVPDLNATAITKTGDLWTLGDHRLLCGDSTHYCDVIVRRWQNATGKKAVRQDGVFFDDLV